MRLLVVEDNQELSGLVVSALRQSGYTCDQVADAESARAFLDSEAPDLIILDLGLPGQNGSQFLRELRRQKNPIPVLIMTARSSISDRVQGLRSGADDYVVKPFALEELLARIEALLRRPRQIREDIYQLGNLTFNADSRQVIVNGHPCLFSAREIAVLFALLRRKGRVVSKAALENDIFGTDADVSSNAVEVYVHRVRKQLQECRSSVEVHTVRGLGYVLKERK